MGDDKPLVSVIIPTYKRPERLLPTVESALGQTYPNIEVIVVDDNGAGTPEQVATRASLEGYVASGRVRYIAHDVNRNGSAARNTGFRASAGAYVNFLDDDDVMSPCKIARQVDRLAAADESTGGCYCNIKMVVSAFMRTKIIEPRFTLEGRFCREYLTRSSFNTSAILFKREAVERLGGFDETYPRHQDYEMMTRFFTLFGLCCCGPDSMIVYDLTRNRQYAHRGADDFRLKEKFLCERKPYLDQMGIYAPVAHRFWLEDVEVALRSHDHSHIRRALGRCRAAAPLTAGEVFYLAKLAVKRLTGMI